MIAYAYEKFLVKFVEWMEIYGDKYVLILSSIKGKFFYEIY